jgi:hypothetical protein
LDILVNVHNDMNTPNLIHDFGVNYPIIVIRRKATRVGMTSSLYSAHPVCEICTMIQP